MEKKQKTPPIRFERSWKSLILNFLLAALVAYVGIVLTINYDALSLRIPLELIGSGSTVIYLPIFLLIFLFVLARPIVKLYDSYYEISDHHIRFYRGLLSFRHKKLEFPFEDLIGVEVSQNIFERLLGIGSIKIGAKTSTIKLNISGIANPQYFADLISERIDNSRMAIKSI